MGQECFKIRGQQIGSRTMKQMFNNISIATVFVLLTIISESSAAQDTLPQGIGFYQLGQRSFSRQTYSYDKNGEKVELGARFDNQFDGKSMLSGSAGAELKRLAEELAKYEGQNPQSQGLIDRLNLGAMSGDVKAKVTARFFGFGYGISDRVTFFFGVPFIDAAVKSNLNFSGENNAQTIKNELGDLAFDELKEGLDRASRINAQQIKQNILNAGFAPFESWEHRGYGDLRLGTKAAFAQHPAKGLKFVTALTPTLEIPTGYTEHADVLTDMSFGKGYYALGLHVDERLVIARSIWIGVDGFFAENFETQIEKRVPEGNESLPNADRKTSVDYVPGDDVDTAASIGIEFGMISAAFRSGAKRHFGDSYNGKLTGNYQALAQNSSTYQVYQQIKLTVSTTDYYKRKSFPVPLIISFGANRPVAAQNSPDETYYEVAFASFFSSPHAKPTDVRTVSKKKKTSS
jgi:hypothetical protein